jgi:hypothetical protein
MYKTVRLQPEANGEVLARFRQHGITVDYAPLNEDDIAMLSEMHDLTGPIELNAVLLLTDMEEKQKSAVKPTSRTPLHSLLRIFAGQHLRRH